MGCYYSDILDAETVYATGSKSAAYASITDTETVYAYGYLAVQGADMDTTDVEYFKLVAEGYYAAYNASIYCQDGTTCKVYCNDTGCADLNYYCYSGATCKQDCSDSCSDCPKIIQSSSLLEDKKFDVIKHMRKENRPTKENLEKLIQIEDASESRSDDITDGIKYNLAIDGMRSNNNNEYIIKNGHNSNNSIFSTKYTSILTIIGCVILFFTFTAGIIFRDLYQYYSDKLSRKSENTYEEIA